MSRPFPPKWASAELEERLGSYRRPDPERSVEERLAE
jgi:hypothetical protein